MARPFKTAKLYDETTVKIKVIGKRYRRSQAEVVDLIVCSLGSWKELDSLFGMEPRRRGKR